MCAKIAAYLGSDRCTFANSKRINTGGVDNLCQDSRFVGFLTRIISDEDNKDAAENNLSSSCPLAFHIWARILWMLPFERSSRYLDDGGG